MALQDAFSRDNPTAPQRVNLEVCFAAGVQALPTVILTVQKDP